MVSDLVETIEKLVDSREDGLLHVITAIELMCQEKADHIEANWQDTKTAQVWRLASKRTQKLACEIEKLGL